MDEKNTEDLYDFYEDLWENLNVNLHNNQLKNLYVL